MRGLAVRAVRSIVGTLLVLVSLPMVLAGGGLWLIAQHRGDGASYSAVTQRVRADGYAVVVEDVDAVLRADLPFARGGQTRLSLSVTGSGGPLFLGLAPYPAVRRYLAGAAYTRVDRVRLARGPLPVDTTMVAGPASPDGLPFGQSFWVATSTGLTRDGRIEDALSWEPSAVRGQRLALVVMNADASTQIDVRLAARLTPGWLVPTIWGLLIFGGMLLIFGATLLAWPPAAAREVVYVVDRDGHPLPAGSVVSPAPVVPAPVVVPAQPVAAPDAGAVDAGPGDSGPADAEPAEVADTGSVETEHTTAAPAAVGSGRGNGAGSSRGNSTIGGVRANGGVRAGWNARDGRAGSRPEPSSWTVLLASTRPPATPRLLWPPKRPDRSAVPPVPSVPTRRSGPLPSADPDPGES